MKLCSHDELLRSFSKEFVPFLMNEPHEANDWEAARAENSLKKDLTLDSILTRERCFI